ncbi:Uma2 family endonuclease [Roseiflexus castenholzii]|jgi:Uma2 family endonuclease|uniref:Response regulator receiver protein n=1 Tax=Roseiflexus castenholzii (strain DSM 13941 / HLO8) TaxID=383372 RepID=A7NPE4_ROSCS|nr:Uma2 family endonuclease [Roseiflexus castenholzii]ABU59440.1 response regulator receiver protein [Roseiflexus castenholzii DSM 13941]
MTPITRRTVEFVETLPHLEGGRYEVIDGALYVTHQPHMRHWITCDHVIVSPGGWRLATGAGRIIPAPDVTRADDEAVAPYLVWIGHARLSDVIGNNGALHAAPDLIIEVVSPGKANEECDCEKKRALYNYNRRDVSVRWIVDRQAMTVDAFRRDDEALRCIATWQPGDVITSLRFPGFSCEIGRFFAIEYPARRTTA